MLAEWDRELRHFWHYGQTMCRRIFPVALQRLVLTYAETMIKAYKQFFAPEKEKEDPALPIEWVRATFHGGPSGKPSVDGNRPNCRCGLLA
jgi:hypothetical protein